MPVGMNSLLDPTLYESSLNYAAISLKHKRGNKNARESGRFQIDSAALAAARKPSADSLLRSVCQMQRDEQHRKTAEPGEKQTVPLRKVVRHEPA